MSEVNIKITLVGLSGLIALFWGEPDIQDAIIYWLTDGTMR